MSSHAEPVSLEWESEEAYASEGRRLADFYSKCFTLILQLRAAQEFGDAAVLRDRTRRVLRKAEDDITRAGFDAADRRLASFAVVAFLDETIQASTWSEREKWLAQPLQLQLFERYDAGEEFFVRLEELRQPRRPSPDDDFAPPKQRLQVIEVYYLCLALGFRGRYQLREREEVQHLIEAVYADLMSSPELRLGSLSPHGYPQGQVAAAVRSRIPAWAVLAAALVLLVTIYAGMRIHISSRAESTVERIEQAAAAPGARVGNATGR